MRHLIPTYQPMAGSCGSQKNEKLLTIPSMVMAKNQPKPGQTLTQHTGLPPRASDGGNPWDKREEAKAAALVRNKAAAKERSDAKKGLGKKGPTRPPAVPR